MSANHRGRRLYSRRVQLKGQIPPCPRRSYGRLGCSCPRHVSRLVGEMAIDLAYAAVSVPSVTVKVKPPRTEVGR